jgi:hypothetical protein
MTMAAAVYILCALTSIVCVVLLARAYVASRNSLILWTCLGFVGLAANNVMLFIDLILLPTSVDLSVARNACSLAGMLLMLFGFIWHAKD